MAINAYWNVTNVLSQMEKNSDLVSKTIERLSSGRKLNRAADDPSGSANATRLSGSIRGVNAAIHNAEQASLMMQMMDEVLTNVNGMLLSMRDLAIRASNEATMTTSTRKTMQTQVREYVNGIATLAQVANLNGKDLFTGKEKLFFESSPAAVNNDIYTANKYGGDLENLTNSSGYDELTARPSPDGTKVAFYDRTAGVQEIFIMDSDGTNIQQLTATGGAKRRFSWAPDGKEIVYEEGNEIYKISTSGGAPVQITFDGGYNYPEWSPDGTMIMYHKGNSIWTMDTSGGSQTEITANAAAHPGNNVFARWSPDGSKIAFVGDSPGTYEVFTMDYDDPDNTRTQITNVGLAGFFGMLKFPSFSLDHEYIFHSDYKGGADFDIYRIDASGTDSIGLFTSTDYQNAATHGPLALTQNMTFETDPDGDAELTMSFYSLLPDTLGVREVNVSTQTGATDAITKIDSAIDRVTQYRTEIGVRQQVFEYAIDDLTSRSINLTSMRSRIEDADMAAEITQLTKSQIIQESAVTALVQANNYIRSVLNLLDGSNPISLLTKL